MPSRSNRGRLWGFVAFVVLCLVAAGAYAAFAGFRERDEERARQLPPPPPGQSGPTLIGAGPVVVFRDLDRQDVRNYGRVSFAPLDAPDGPRTVTPLTCARVDIGGGRGICLEQERGFGVKSTVRIFDASLKQTGRVEVTGLPSRARVSPDGRWGAVTTFVTGHSYAEPGTFSTLTTLIDLRRAKAVVDLERFRVLKDGREIDHVDFNFWGVTWTGRGTEFYATLATRGKTYLVKGDLPSRTVRTLRENVECPSLSPDGTRLAFKKRVGDVGVWRLHVLDLATMRETRLAEERVVDDQVEWLDDGNVLYRVDEEVWTTPADGSGQPRRYLAAAESPSVVSEPLEAAAPPPARAG